MNEATPNYVAASDVARLLKDNDAVILIDARTAEEFDEGHASGAVNIPIAALAEFAKSRDIESAGPVITMCGSTGRGEKAAAILDSQGVRNVLVLEGGLKAWRDAGLPAA